MAPLAMNIVLKKMEEREKERKQRKIDSLLERLTNGRGSAGGGLYVAGVD